MYDWIDLLLCFAAGYFLGLAIWFLVIQRWKSAGIMLIGVVALLICTLFHIR
jgi:hypothetical protein